jgi:hypothetical protein
VAREPDVPPSTAHPTPSAATSGRLSALADPRARLADGPVSPRGARPASLLLGSPAHCWRRPRALGPPPRRRSQPVCDKRPGRPRALIGCAHTPCARSPTSVTGPASSCSSSRRRSPCCCLRPCAHAAHRHTPNRKIETLRGGVDRVSRTSDGLRRPAAKGSCLSCREPVPPLRRSSVVRRSSCCAPDGRRASCLRAWASLSRRCATGVARTRSIAMSVTTVSRAMSALSWRGCGARTRGSARSATCSSEPRPFFATESGTR